MSAVFSASSPLQERPQQGVELQMLAADELLSLWEQTQRAVWTMEEKGVEAGLPAHYGQMVVWEMQRRVSLSPSALFSDFERVEPKEERLAPGPLPHIMTLRF